MQVTDYIGEQLYKAVRILVGEDDIRSRLEGVHERCFWLLGPPAYPFPARLRERLETVQAKLKPEALNALDEDDCSALAFEILSLWEDYQKLPSIPNSEYTRATEQSKT